MTKNAYFMGISQSFSGDKHCLFDLAIQGWPYWLQNVSLLSNSLFGNIYIIKLL